MSFLTSLLNALPGAVAQGLIWGIMAIGVYITYRVLDIADLADRRAAALKHKPHFAAGHSQRDVFAFHSHDLRGHTRASGDLSALAWGQLDVVHHGTYGNIFKGKRIADLDVRGGAAHELVAHVEADGRENIRLYAVRVREERDVGASVGIVLNALYRRGDTVFRALEVDDAVFGTVAAADVTAGDFALVVAAAAVTLVVQQGFFGLISRQLRIGGRYRETTAGRSRFICFDCHFSASSDYDNESKNSMGLLSSFKVTTAFLRSGV